MASKSGFLELHPLEEPPKPKLLVWEEVTVHECLKHLSPPLLSPFLPHPFAADAHS